MRRCNNIVFAMSDIFITTIWQLQSKRQIAMLQRHCNIVFSNGKQMQHHLTFSSQLYGSFKVTSDNNVATTS